MSMLPDERRISEADYLALDGERDVKYEFVGGIVRAMSGGSPQHVTISTNITGMMHHALRGGVCQVFHSDMRVHNAATGSYLYPDVSAVCGEPEYVAGVKNGTLLNPVLIVEVLSPSTELYDRREKFDIYRRLASLRDYVLVAQDQPRVERYTRNPDGTWIVAYAEGAGESILLPSLAVTLQLADIYERVTFPPDEQTGDQP